MPPRWRRRAAPPPDAGPDEHEREILAALGRLRDTTAREVMTPRVDVIALRAPVSADAVGAAIKESGHSRFPVYTDDLDHLEGVLFVKDMFRSGGAIRLRKPFVVPEHRKVLELLQEMRQRHHAFAVVIDEHGGVEGVLTVKDVVSELVGDLHDEFDTDDDEDIVRVDPTRWLVDGACAVDRLAEEVGVPVPEGDYVTVGGLLFDRFGRIPAEGDTADIGGWHFRVTEMDRRRIAKAVVRAPSGSLDADGK